MDRIAPSPIVIIHKNLQHLSKQLQSFAVKHDIPWYPFEAPHQAENTLSQIGPSVVIFEVKDSPGFRSFLQKAHKGKAPHIFIGAGTDEPEESLMKFCYRHGMHQYIHIDEWSHHTEHKIRNFHALLARLSGTRERPEEAGHGLPREEMERLLKQRTEQLSMELEKNLLTEIRSRDINLKWYVQLADNISAGLGIYSKDGICKYVNKMGLVNTKMSIEELLGKSIHECFPAELAGNLQNAIDRVVKTGEQYHRSNEVTLEEHKFYADTTVSPIMDEQGEISDVMFLTYDVTAYKEIERSLLIQRRISELSVHSYTLKQLFKKILDELLEIHWIGCGGIYIYHEKEKALKLEHHRNLSRSFIRSTSEYDESTPQFQLVMQKKPVFAGTEEIEETIRRQLVHEAIRFITILPLFDDKQLIGCINLGSFTNTTITENDRISIESIAHVISNVIVKTNAFNLLKDSKKLLEKTLNELSSKQQLLIQKSKLESLGELSSGIAHEINQPLSIIAMAVENMKIKWEQGIVSPPYMNDKFDQIFDYIEKIREIINHIRVFSRDQGSVRFDRIDVEKTIRKAISIVHQQYSDSNILIIIKSGKAAGFTVGNETQLEQVFLNLFSNSKYALLQKERSILSEQYKMRIDINISSNDRFIEIEFCDNGTGIPESAIDHVFDPFFTTKPETEGTGLGLSIVYGIIKAMNGDIRVESNPGNWTRFNLALPRFDMKVK
jgi:PAS domain S-box-containing protein